MAQLYSSCLLINTFVNSLKIYKNRETLVRLLDSPKKESSS